MIITGGGPGIMQAGNEGAGSDNSFAVNIRLPFEQAPNIVMANTPATDHLQILFQPQGCLCQGVRCHSGLPGRFRTLDEAMEVFTLSRPARRTRNRCC